LQAAEDRNAVLLEDNRKDERVLRQLEKSLKMKKKKSNSLPLAFVNDGLDCIFFVPADHLAVSGGYFQNF